MVISDAYSGEDKAIKESFPYVLWHWCDVLFMRNAFDNSPSKNTEEVRNELKMLFKTTNIEIARRLKYDIVDKFIDKHSKMS